MPKTKNKNGLTQKQENFVFEYLKSGNATEAAIKAGYSKKTAYSIGEENLRKPVIVAEIDRSRQKVIEKHSIDVDWLINQLKENHEIARELCEISNSNKALELIGRTKVVSAFEKEVQAEVNIHQSKDVKDLKDELKRIRRQFSSK